MYDFERMLFYCLKTVFTEILNTRILKWDIICVYKCQLLTDCLRLFDTFLRCVNTCNNVYYIYKTEWILEGRSNCCLNFALQCNCKYWIGTIWVGGSMYHGLGIKYTMGRGVKRPYV
jgi:hypothetical protein